MKTKLSILLLTGFFLTSDVNAEYKTIVVDGQTNDGSIEIKEGQVGQVVFASLVRPDGSSEYWRENGYIKVIKNGVEVEIRSNKISRQFEKNPSANYPIVVGPAVVKLRRLTTAALLTMKITPNETATSKAAGPALVLPEGEDGKR